jgi:hypothetical protein
MLFTRVVVSASAGTCPRYQSSCSVRTLVLKRDETNIFLRISLRTPPIKVHLRYQSITTSRNDIAHVAYRLAPSRQRIVTMHQHSCIALGLHGRRAHPSPAHENESSSLIASPP